MRRRILSAAGGLLLLLLAAPPASAQDWTLELGMDARARWLDPEFGDGIFSFQLPAPLVRLGILVGERTTIEPALALNWFLDDGNTSSDIDLFVNILLHTRPLDQGPVYFGGGAGVRRLGGGGDPVNAFTLGARAGVKPLIGDVLLGRAGLYLLRRLSSDTVSGLTEFGVELGLSVLIR